MRGGIRLGLLWGLFAISAGCGGESSSDFTMAGGDTTIFVQSSSAFETPAGNLSDPARMDRHVDGDAAFDSTFVTSPAIIHGGLGPVYNHTSCAGCHPRDGRGLPVISNGPLRTQLLVRVSLPGVVGAHGEPVEVPGLGTQVQDQAVFGVEPEAALTLSWQEQPPIVLSGGGQIALRKPAVAIVLRGGAPIDPAIPISLRLPPPVFGLGLLEAIPDSTLMAISDEQDRNGDGISGRPNLVWDPYAQAQKIGRFGQKANTATLATQVAAAYFNDMGIGNSMFPDSVGGAEVTDEILSVTEFYVQTLGVPARRPLSSAASRGESLFGQIGCVSCHVATLHTGPSSVLEVANQEIHPYTDLLLHDMGPGLADGRPDFVATGSEWRTAPLWGIGLAETVLPSVSYLHDGRARTLLEAILWHGGEAEGAKGRFLQLSAADRDAVIAFLRAL